MCLSTMALDNDPYYAQLLLDRSDALFLTDKASIDSDVRVDCLWYQCKEKNSTSKYSGSSISGKTDELYFHLEKIVSS